MIALAELPVLTEVRGKSRTEGTRTGQNTTGTFGPPEMLFCSGILGSAGLVCTGMRNPEGAQGRRAGAVSRKTFLLSTDRSVRKSWCGGFAWTLLTFVRFF